MAEKEHTLYCPEHDVEWIGPSDEHAACVGVIDITWELTHGGMEKWVSGG